MLTIKDALNARFKIYCEFIQNSQQTYPTATCLDFHHGRGKRTSQWPSTIKKETIQ